MITKNGNTLGRCPICNSRDLTPPEACLLSRGGNGLLTLARKCQWCGSAIGEVFKHTLIEKSAESKEYELEYLRTQAVNPLLEVEE